MVLHAANRHDELFVPGRLCLLGEHSDWAAGYRDRHPELPPGYCLVVGTEQGLRARAGRCDDVFEVTSLLPHGEEIGPVRIEANAGALHAAARGAGFFSYAAGTAAEMVERFGVGGLRLHIRGDLPVRKGLSSSAAVSVLVARAYAAAWELELSLAEQMDVAYSGERRSGSECGRLDQVCAYGRRVTFLCIDAPGLTVETLQPGGRFHLLVVDLRRDKDTRRILADLNACYPEAPGTIARGVREALGPCNAELVARARRAIESGDPRLLGALMREAQSLFDEKVAPACPELVAPRLHEVLDHPAVEELAHGGKGVGSQGDGCAQLVARGPQEREELAGRLEADLGVRCMPLTVEGAPL
jgi:galactokinase